MKSYFITLEGPDGSGKSTMTRFLSEYLTQKGYEIVITREPGGTDISEDIRKIILDNKNTNIAYTTEALLYAASRAQHVHEKILPALNEGKIIICDRFVLSSLVYQGIARGLGIEEVKKINDFATQGLEPDLILLFDIDPEVSLRRKTKKGNADRLEKEDISFHKKVYSGYMNIKDMYYEKIKIVDASKDKHEVFNNIKELVDNLIK
ncbi:thymidylate kinase Tmk [Gottschalkia purinilytica]|uniref:Thymidylate kinase n=1 Tax=Gottschalkia purinilytica TaxID=1503 RepID=A0A0L0WEH8_GOTPU|nr:dTMP kinase [Gottschalkia purinilytica]KNF09830.1 thymidylate kinase Tmk [Gottschalkia purinilytica]